MLSRRHGNSRLILICQKYRRLNGCVASERKEIGEFHEERTIEAGDNAPLRRELIVIHHEEIAPGRVDETQQDIGEDLLILAVPLDECLGKKTRGKGIRESCTKKSGCRIAAGDIDDVPLTLDIPGYVRPNLEVERTSVTENIAIIMQSRVPNTLGQLAVLNRCGRADGGGAPKRAKKKLMKSAAASTSAVILRKVSRIRIKVSVFKVFSICG